jgi:hypothetical protein
MGVDWKESCTYKSIETNYNDSQRLGYIWENKWNFDDIIWDINDGRYDNEDIPCIKKLILSSIGNIWKWINSLENPDSISKYIVDIDEKIWFLEWKISNIKGQAGNNENSSQSIMNINTEIDTYKNIKNIFLSMQELWNLAFRSLKEISSSNYRTYIEGYINLANNIHINSKISSILNQSFVSIKYPEVANKPNENKYDELIEKSWLLKNNKIVQKMEKYEIMKWELKMYGNIGDLVINLKEMQSNGVDAIKNMAIKNINEVFKWSNWKCLKKFNVEKWDDWEEKYIDAEVVKDNAYLFLEIKFINEKPYIILEDTDDIEEINVPLKDFEKNFKFSKEEF